MTLKTTRSRCVSQLVQLPPVVSTPNASTAYLYWTSDGPVLIGRTLVSIGAGEKPDVLVVGENFVRYNVPLEISEVRHGTASIRHEGSSWVVNNANFEIRGELGERFVFVVEDGSLKLKRNGIVVAAFNTVP